MDYAALRAEIENDPEALGYAGKNPVEIAALLNAADRDGTAPVATVAAKRVLILAGKWPAIVIAARGDNPAAVNMVEAFATFTDFDLAVPAYASAIGAGLDALIGASLIDAADKAAVLALATVKISRAAELGLPPIGPDDVRRAAERGEA